MKKDNSLESLQMIIWPCSVEIYEDNTNNLEKIINDFKNWSEKIYNWLISWKIWLRWWCWKPRTTPWWFEWYWEKAVDIMSDIQEKYWIICITEIWTVNHFSYCLKKWLRTFWIWARTSSSPFFMEELIDFMKKHKEYNCQDIVIWVKNPIWFDIDLWNWNIKRLKDFWFNIFPIHRWCNYDKTLTYEYKYNRNWNHLRNLPMLFSESEEIKEKLNNMYDNYLFFEDYSHQLWNRDLIFSLLKSLKNSWTLIYDEKLQKWIKKDIYVMIEVHQDPEIALTDKQQQLSTQDIIDLIS